MAQTKVQFQKPVDGNRKRVAAHISESSSSAFGIEVQVKRQVTRKQEGLYPSGHPETGEGHRTVLLGGDGAIQPGNQNYREVIPPGKIGTEEKYDIQLPPPQYVDTVQYMRDEDKCPRLHGAMDALKASDTLSVPFQPYADFQPRSAPLPRALQDEVGFGRGDRNENTSVRLGADPLMSDNDSFTLFGEREVLRKDLYGDNVSGVLHNQNMPMNTQPQTTRGAGRVGRDQSPPATATQYPPQSQNPYLRNNVTLNTPTKQLPKRNMPVQGATRAKRGG